MIFLQKVHSWSLTLLAIQQEPTQQTIDVNGGVWEFGISLLLALGLSYLIVNRARKWLSEKKYYVEREDGSEEAISRWSQLSYLHRASIVWLIGFVVAVLLLSFTSFTSGFHVIWKSATIAVVFILVASVFAIQFWNRTFKDAVEEEKRKNPYRKMFFGSTRILSLILLAVGLTGAFLLLFSNDGKNHAYEAMGLVVIVTWSVVFLRFFIWAVYHYNINFGLTDKDWDRVMRARDRKADGDLVDEEQLKAPKYNPYRSQTFGLPPGTVRGMIAFTLLFGAIAMLIVSMGMNGSIEQDSFFWDHFEFYKTAFLMMIAFYFGDRSLKYLQKRWPSVQQGKIKKAQAGGGKDQPDDEVGEDDAEFRNDNDLDESITSTPRGFSPSSLMDILSNAESGQADMSNAENSVLIHREHSHVYDLELERKLDKESIELAASQNGISSAVLRAIIAVESSGSGFLSDGRPKILFEGHKFWRWLKKKGLDPKEYQSENPDIVYSSWTRKYYKGGKAEYDRFERASAIDKEAAIYATSWGLFQILGENFSAEGYCKRRVIDSQDFEALKNEREAIIEQLSTQLSAADRRKLEKKEDELELALTAYQPIDRFPEEFIEKQSESEFYHLLDFIDFIKSKYVKYRENGVVKFQNRLIEAIRDEQNINWEAFAYGYNGSGFKEHKYHIKLQKAYDRFKNQA